MKQLITLAAFTLLLSGQLVAQKYGHLNFGNLVSVMPDTEKAQADLQAFEAQLEKQGEEMVAKFQAEYEVFVTEVNGGDLTPKAQQVRQEELQKKQQAIAAFEQKASTDLEKKRNELLGPIIKKAQDAIAKVSKANGYQLVFDTSVFNAVLFTQESDDLMPLVTADLGIEMEEE
ncbi:MAG: OmpH family outer membrane protein [Saprospiraceae bacterium]